MVKSKLIFASSPAPAALSQASAVAATAADGAAVVAVAAAASIPLSSYTPYKFIQNYKKASKVY